MRECAHPPGNPEGIEPAVVGLLHMPGRITGAKALFCFTALIILAGEKEKIPGAPPHCILEAGTEGGREGECVGATAEQNIKQKIKIEDGKTNTGKLIY